jgi:glutaredoxin
VPCHRTEKFLREKGVGFTTKDVTKDAEALAEVQSMGATGTPVIVIDGEEVLFGFDRKKLEESLGL